MRAAILSAAGLSGAGRSNHAPGILLCIAVSAAAAALEGLEVPVFGRVWIEALVLAILLGAVVRTMWSPGARWLSGIRFSAHTLLEVAVVLLGASVTAQTILAIGPGLLGGIAVVVPMAIIKATEWADCLDCRPEW